MNITLALIISFAVSLVVTAALGYVLIPVLHKLKFGQNILIYVEKHKEKSGTATMGGLIFILTTIIGFLIFIIAP